MDDSNITFLIDGISIPESDFMNLLEMSAADYKIRKNQTIFVSLISTIKRGVAFSPNQFLTRRIIKFMHMNREISDPIKYANPRIPIYKIAEYYREKKIESILN